MGDKGAEPVKEAKSEEEELSELLDSALADFSTAPPTEGGEEWTEDFIRQAAAQLESNLSHFIGGPELSQDQVQAKFQEMAAAAQQVLAAPQVSEDSTDFASAISQTVQGLSAGAEGLQNPFTEQDIMGLFGGQGGGDGNAFLPFMQGMMQSLLSKEVLYPSLKDIVEKFPEWLERNKDTLAKEDVERYENQTKLMQDVCGELEKEQESDSVEVKKERFEKVLGLMQKLQDYGQPPTELVGDVGPPFPLDMQANNDPNQCNLM